MNLKLLGSLVTVSELSYYTNSLLCSIISSLMPRMFLFELPPLELPELLLFLLAPDAFDELGDDVDALFEAEFPLDALFALLLLFELPLPPELEDPDDPPDDCFSFLLSFIIIYTVADHLVYT